MLIVHDASQVRRGAALCLALAIEPCDAGLQLREQLLLNGCVDEHVVRRQAGLTRIEELPPCDPLRRGTHVRRRVHDCRRLASQLQGHRRQVLGGGRHHLATDRCTAGEEDVIEGKLEQGLRRLGTAFDQRHLPLIERLAHQRCQEMGRGRRLLGRLEHHAVAGRNRSHEWVDDECHGIVPWRQDEHHAARLDVQPAGGADEEELRAPAPSPHPAREAADGVVDLLQHVMDLSQLRLGPRPGEVGVNGVRYGRAVLHDRRAQPLEPPAPLGSGRARHHGRLLPLALEDLVQSQVHCGLQL